MGKLMNLKPFDPYMDQDESNRPQHARMSATHSKTYHAMTLALRPCGVTAYEAAERLNALGGQPYTPSYTKSAQFAPSYYSRLGYGAFGQVERVGDHLAAVEAHMNAAGENGKEEADYVRSCLPSQSQDDDSEVLVIYAWAQGGQAVGRYGNVVLEDLPASKDEVMDRRAKLVGEKKAGSKKKSSSKRTARK